MDGTHDTLYVNIPRVGSSPARLSAGEGSQVGKVSDISPSFDDGGPNRGFSPYPKGGGMVIKLPIIVEKEDDGAPCNSDVDKEVRPRCKRTAVTILRWVALVSGLFMMFIVPPVLTHGAYGPFEARHGRDSPLAEKPLSGSDHPLFGNVRSTLIDPDTPKSALTRDSVFGGRNLKLVFSDEFNKDGRTFYEGDDLSGRR